MQTTKAGTSSKATTGILLMSVGVASLCINDAIAKTLTEGYSPIQILFLRNIIALPFAVLIAVNMGGRGALVTHRPVAHLLRGVLWLVAATLFFTSFIYLGLAEATALIFVMPVFVTAISALILREPTGWRRWLAVLVGFAGVLVIVRPGGETFQAASLLPVTTAFFYALLMLSARWVDPRESVWTMMLYLVGAGALLSAFVMPFVWVSPRLEDALLFLGLAVFGTAGITLMTQAFRFAPAAVVAPFDYTALLWATLLGYLLWDEIPDAATYLGAAIIIASGIYIVWRERKLEN